MENPNLGPIIGDGSLDGEHQHGLFHTCSLAALVAPHKGQQMGFKRSLSLVWCIAFVILASCRPEPVLNVSTLVSGLTNPWDLAWLPDGTLLVTERPGRLNVYVDGPENPPVVFTPLDVVAAGEGGMLGLDVDPLFSENGYVYVCMVSDADGPTDVRVARFTLSSTGNAILDRTDIVTGITYGGGRHSGCRPRFGPDGYLWVGTGDAAIGTVPQDEDSLGGKVLRVTRDGNAAPDNPSGRLWYSKGHRNVQGIAFFPFVNGVVGISAEHGPDVDDEVNLLVPGNFGWDPIPGYNEAVPMTDLQKFPDAVEAIWSSGSPTIAPSGATFLTGPQWLSYENCLAVATLKAQHLHLFVIANDGQAARDFVRITNQGRLRSPRQGPDGNLYITTDQGGTSGRVIKVVPTDPNASS